MNLLLLLSALFSALAGIGGGVRAPDAVQAVAGTPVVQAAATLAQRIAPTRPVAALPTLRTLAYRAGMVTPIMPPAPLWADRRRE